MWPGETEASSTEDVMTESYTRGLNPHQIGRFGYVLLQRRIFISVSVDSSSLQRNGWAAGV